MSRIDPHGRTLVVTGVGCRSSGELRPDTDVFRDDEVKPNIGAAIGLEAARRGYGEIVLVSRTQSKLDIVRDSVLRLVPGANVTPKATDLCNPEAVRELAESLPVGREVDLAHSAGLSAGNYSVPDDNPYLTIENTPPDFAILEFEAVLKTLVVTVQALLPRWRAQDESRVVVVSSMSGIRPVPYGLSHCSAKAGLHHAVRSMTLELNKEGIRVSEVLPGIVDTGMYDSKTVLAAAQKISGAFGYDYPESFLPQMSPQDVGEAVMMCLTSGAHLLGVSMVAQGQFPQMGA